MKEKNLIRNILTLEFFYKVLYYFKIRVLFIRVLLEATYEGVF